MMGKSNTKVTQESDTALLELLGEYIRHHRLKQNKSQEQLAQEAGINRSTLVEFERGGRSNTLTFIQLLRALDQLHMLETFYVVKKPSPLQLAKLEQDSRKRASKTKTAHHATTSDW